MSCESKQEGFKEAFNSIDFTATKPSVFLTHPCDLPEGKMISLGCQYYALGHEHYQHIKKVSKNIYKGRPGHIYSIWDGNGKAWPVGAILGKFKNSTLQLEWLPFHHVPQTIRLYIDRFNRKEKSNEILFCIENCPQASVKQLKQICEGEWQDDKFRGVYKGYYSPGVLPTERLVRGILSIFINDIFITPSDSKNMKKKYGYNRASITSKTLLKDKCLFNEFVERVFKASSKTQ